MSSCVHLAPLQVVAGVDVVLDACFDEGDGAAPTTDGTISVRSPSGLFLQSDLTWGADAVDLALEEDPETCNWSFPLAAATTSSWTPGTYVAQISFTRGPTRCIRQFELEVTEP